jgi:uncharacterized protein
MTVILDSWAVMRLLEGTQPAADRVQEQLDNGGAVMNWINLGEIYYVLARVFGHDAATLAVRDLENSVQAIVPDRALILEAARIKSEHRMSYADAFAAATAVRWESPLWTGDPELLVSEAPWNAVNPALA